MNNKGPARLEITEEIVQKAGYPSVELFEMDGELAKLASRYNVTRDPEVLKRHQALYDKMLKMGMTPLMFGADTEILREEDCEPRDDSPNGS